MNAILQVIAWMFAACAKGETPAHDHLGMPLKCAPKSIGRPALLVQVRADWPALRGMFRFPAWNSPRICWRCQATQVTYRSCGSTAPWRSQRCSSDEYMRDCRAAGYYPALFVLPWLTVDHVVIDWLHTVDLGILRELHGNALFELMEEQDGTNMADRCLELWQKVQTFYKVHKPPSRLDNLVVEMFREDATSPPSLKAKGGESRYLLPIMYELTAHWRADAGKRHQYTAGEAIRTLYELQLLISVVPYDKVKAAQLCKTFCCLYTALEQEALAAGNNYAWRCKPKLHMLQEMVEYAADDWGSPENFWTYVDESWVGFISKIAQRRGGRIGPNVPATRLLSAYRAGAC